MNGFDGIKKILLVTSNQTASDIIQFDLTREGYRVFPAAELAQGINMMRRQRMDAAVLDFHNDSDRALKFCEEMRENGEPMPVIVLAGSKAACILMKRHMEYIEILEKPFHMKSLKMSLMRLIQRTSCFFNHSIYLPEDCEIIISTEDYQVYKQGSPILLSQTEYELFVFLASHPGKVYSRNELMERVWNYESTGNDLRMVDVAIRRLRAKIEDDPAHPFLILTKRGAGYYFAPIKQAKPH